MFSVKKTALCLATAGLAVLASSGAAFADAEAEGFAANSPGFLSGNNVQIPINIPINVCGNDLGVGNLLSPTFGTTCINADIENTEVEHEDHHGEHHNDH
ncbi:chaplin [Wenjunlia tyrosinilytica]|uniref:Small membrane protein n=1 Tax=Wenjunlia tyrosinilytica TaxID=1544741 RepID=A0A918DRH5_9ACTN|nr:chaplin [Wenjunlia tyrosinilytica]GGO81132.1 small membrane protein [Wenjunlia tyrosinilytica]